ncbi:adenosine deaminase family protein [Geodermatophilus sp. SYSU D00815]
MPSSKDPNVTYDLLPMEPDEEVALLARRVPKAEMHMHHMGSQSPSEYARLVKATRGTALSRDEANAAYDNRGVGKFFDDLDRAVKLWGDSATVTTGALRMICDAYDRGVRHLELFCTPDLHRAEIGMPPAVLLPAVADAFAVARDELGLTGGIIVAMHRFDGPDAALALVEEVLPLRDQGLTILGVGNDGDHRTVPFEALAPAYERARAEGFRLCGHADELEDVVAALDIGLDRIDHGWMAADDPAVLARLVEAGVGLTFTPSGYALGGLHSDSPWHKAWTVMTDAGVPLAIGTDDPELHHTDIAQDYALLARKLGWNKVDVGAAAKTSFDLAWYDDSVGAGERAAWAAEIDALVADPRAPRR